MGFGKLFESLLHPLANLFCLTCSEYGYSIEDPNTLTIWEAQFGDFSNGAQVLNPASPFPLHRSNPQLV